MKKALLTAIAISALLTSLMGTYLPHSVRADSAESIGTDSGAFLLSPANTTYNSRFLTLNLTLGAGLGVQYSLNYSIDGKYGGPIPLVAQNPTEMHVINTMIGSVELPELSEGSHCLTVYELSGIYGYHGANPPGPPFKPASPGSADYVASWTHTVYFTINSPSPSSLSPSHSPSLPTLTVSPTITPSPSLNVSTSFSSRVKEHFAVDSTLYAFQGSLLFCAFNSTRKSWVELNLTLTGDNSFETTFEVCSNNHGVIYNSSIYGSVGMSNLTQIVNLSYDDAYNVTVSKHPFYSTVVIAGTIDLYSQDLANSTSNDTFSTPASAAPSVPEFPTWAVLLLFAVLAVLVVVYVKRES